jgi:hypothetical protein
MLIGVIVTQLFALSRKLSVPDSPQVKCPAHQEFLLGAGLPVFNRRTVARCWMIRATAVGSSHMTLCFPFVENGEGGSHHGNDQEERF